MRAGAPLLLVVSVLLLAPEPRYPSGMLAAARKARKPRSNPPAIALAQLSERFAELERGQHLIRPVVVAQLDIDMATMRDLHRHASFDALHGSFIVRWRHLLEQPNAQVRRGRELLASAMARAPEPGGLVALGAVQVMLNDFEGAVSSLATGCGVGKSAPTDGARRQHVANACVQLAMVLQQYRPQVHTTVLRIEDIVQHGLQVAGQGAASEVCELRTLAATLSVMSQNGDRIDKAAVKELAAEVPPCIPAQLYQKMGYGLQRMELESTRRMVMLDQSSWELLFALFEGLHQAGLHDAADGALRAALRVHPALAQKLELQYLRSGPAQPLAHLRRAVELLRTVDDRQLMQVSAAEAEALSVAPSDGSVNSSTVGTAPFSSLSLPLPGSFCPAGRRRESSTTAGQYKYGQSLRPPLPDRQLGRECKRISASDAAKHFKENNGWEDPVVVVSADPGRAYEPPSWTSPQELVRLAGNETFRISWLYNSGHLNEVHSAKQWREDPAVQNVAETNSLDLNAARVLLRPPMAAVSMGALVHLMQRESTNATLGDGAPDPGVATPTDLSDHVLRTRMYLNQKAVPNFIEPLADSIGGPPQFLQGSDGRRSLSHFWMGNAEVTTGLHTDDFDNVIAVLRGRKSVLLFRPEERKNLYYDAAIDVCVKFDLSSVMFRGAVDLID